MKAIVTVVIGQKWHNMFRQVFMNPMNEYAQKCHVPLLVIDEPLEQEWAHKRNFAWQKLLLWRDPRLEKCDEVVFLDADIFCTPTAPDLFKLMPEGIEWGGVAENDNGMDFANVKWVYNTRGITVAEPNPLLINTGVLYLKKSMRTVMEQVYFDDPQKTIAVEQQYEGWYEEPYFSNVLVRYGRYGRCMLMSRQFNRMLYRDMPRFGTASAYYKTLLETEYFLHCAGDGKRADMLSTLAQLYEEYSSIHVERKLRDAQKEAT